MIFRLWPDRFKERFQNQWPETYLCFDIETTGLEKTKDLILEFGYCFVVAKQVVEKKSFICNWLDYEHFDPEDVLFLLKEHQAYCEKNKQEVFFTADVLEKEGVHPSLFFSEIRQVFERIRQQTEFIAGHNVYRFDIPFLVHSFFLYSSPFSFSPFSILDTAYLEKANQALSNVNVVPKEKDTIEDYFLRLGSLQLYGIKYNLHDHCVRKYQLEKYYLESSLAGHRALTDSLLCHGLMEAYRQGWDKPKAQEVELKAVPDIPPFYEVDLPKEEKKEEEVKPQIKRRRQRWN